MPRGDDLHEGFRLSEREDDSEDIGYGGGTGGGASYDDDDDEEGSGWGLSKDHTEELWDSTEDSDDEEDEEGGATAEVADDEEDDGDLFGAPTRGAGRGRGGAAPSDPAAGTTVAGA